MLYLLVRQSLNNPIYNIDATIKNAVSSFGRIPYGHKIPGRLLFDVDNQLGCQKFQREAREDPLVGESPFIMVQEGTCSIVDKVHNIESSGGHLAIIISDSDEEIGGIFMSDEGAGYDITIPAILISKSDGKILANYYINHVHSHQEIKDIRIEVKFENEKLDNTVKYDLWYSPDQENAYIFFKEFRNLQKALGDSAILGVHFFTYPHFNYDPGKRIPIKNCLGSGLYCVRPGKLGVSDGTNVIRESIRQKCIYNFAYNDKNKKSRSLFWDYIENFYDKCITERTLDIPCSEKILKKLRISIDYVNKCYENSFIGTKYANYDSLQQNEVLNNEYELRKKNFITKSPSITINDRVYMDSWKPESVFESLCASLINKPESCYMEVTFERNLKGVSLVVFLIIIFVVLVINIILFMICKRIIKKGIEERVDSTDINSKIDTVVGSYLALRDSAPGED